MEHRKHISLLQLQEEIGSSLEGHFSEDVWVLAEVSDLKERSGHCYLTLVEKDSGGTALKAKVSAIVWASSWRLMKPYFESETGQRLTAGMKILVLVQVRYSALYGLSLIVSDIDASFTIGELELARQRTILRLQEEGMMEMNSSLELPRLPRRLAVVSGEGAAGYRDFMRHLHENEYGYRFYTELYPALMQGADAPASIVSALEKISERVEEYDAVLIMRGGGGAMDLVCYDDYELAVHVAQFPIPVLTGIGHDHDYHVVDMVACINVKTPTALADFIVDIFLREEMRVESLLSRLRNALAGKSSREMARFEKYILRMRSAVTLLSLTQTRRLDRIESRVAMSDPSKVLANGYAVACCDGRKVDSVMALREGEKLTVLFRDGLAETEIKRIKITQYGGE